MKKRSVAVNILTAIPAIILSILLVVGLLGSAVYSVVLASVTPKAISDVVHTTVKEVVKSPDFEQMILDNETVKANIEELGITTAAVGELMQSKAVTEVVDLLSTDFANILTGKEEIRLTPDALVTIVKDHADELADIAVEMTEEPLKKEEIKQQIISTVERDAKKLTDALPDVESIRQSVTDNRTTEKLLALLNSTYLWIVYGVCLVLALLIYALRCYRFGGFLWLGVDGIVAGGLVGGVIWAIRYIGMDYLPDSLDKAQSVVNAILNRMVQSLQWRMWICLGVSLLLIVGFILLRILVVKKKLAAAHGAPVVEAAPAIEVAPVAVSETGIQE